MKDTYQEKEQILKKVGKLYCQGMLVNKLLLQGFDTMSKYFAILEKTAKIREVLRQMDKDDALIIINNYIEPKDKEWWQRNYISRSMYYRHLRLAIDNFFQLAKEINFDLLLKGVI